MIDLSGSVGGMPKLAMIGIIGSVVVGITYLLSSYFNRSARDKNVRKLIDTLDGSLQESKRRLAIIQKHAKEYVNHIDPMVRGDLNIAKRLISCTEQLLANTESLLADGSYTSIIEAEALLDTPLSEIHNPVDSLMSVDNLPGIYPHQLEETVDIIFQRVGEEVAKASKQAKRLGFNPRKRGSTVESLVDAGVRYVNRQRRKFSSGAMIRPEPENSSKN